MKENGRDTEDSKQYVEVQVLNAYAIKRHRKYFLSFSNIYLIPLQFSSVTVTFTLSLLKNNIYLSFTSRNAFLKIPNYVSIVDNPI